MIIVMLRKIILSKFMDDDEYCEVTPDHVRLRKQILDSTLREKEAKKRKIASKK